MNESITDGSLESFIYTMRIGMKGGIFTDAIFLDIKKNFLGGVIGSLKNEMSKIPADKMKEFGGYVNQLIKPLERSSNIQQFLSNLGMVADTKNNIINRLSISEVVLESTVMNTIKKLNQSIKSAITGAGEWWDENKSNIILTISEILVQLLVNILFIILEALLKTKLDKPKIKFGGGKFGGGGSSGKW
jgi:hypothetical protein